MSKQHAHTNLSNNKSEHGIYQPENPIHHFLPSETPDRPTDRPTLNTGHAITESQHWGWRKEGRNTHEVFSRFLLSFLAVYFVRWWWQKRPLERKQKVRSSYKHDPHIFFFLPPFLSQSRVSFYFSTGCFNILTQYWILTMYIRKSKCNMNDLI